MNDLIAFLSNTFTAPTFITGIVCLLLVLAGLSVIKNMKKDSPLEPYILQILGLLFIVPVVALLSIVLELKSEAITGILGTIVGYIFGTSAQQQKISNQVGTDLEKETTASLGGSKSQRPNEANSADAKSRAAD